MDKSGIEVLFWDFDGVVIDSNKVRERGFIEVLSAFKKQEVDQLLTFHYANGGLSRYVKFRYFFEVIKKENISEDKILEYAGAFSAIMKKLLTDRGLLIEKTLQYIDRNYKKYKMFLVSGSDQEELRFLCRELGIAHYFKSILGSPTPKTEIVSHLINLNQFSKDKCIMIGDSKNDYDAAHANGIHFVAYNNPQIEMYTNFDFSFS